MKKVTLVHVGAERRDYLKNYIRCCVRDSALSVTDLVNPLIVDKLLKVLSHDVKIITMDFGRKTGASLMNAGAIVLAGLADNVKKSKTK